ncbi:MAG: glycosyltransferase [Nitrospirota bacterium]
MLIVLDCGIESPSAMVRGVQYDELFKRHAEWHADYVSRRSLFMSRLLRPGHRPSVDFAVLTLRRSLERLNERMIRSGEDRIVEQAAAYDIVYELKVPSMPLHERLCALRGPRVVMDLSDGLWLPFHRRAGWEPLDEMLKSAGGVICENEYGAKYARQRNAHVFVVPDPPQVEEFDAARGRISRDPARVVLGWIGSPATVSALYKIWEPLEALFARHAALHLRIVGASPSDLPRFERVRWSCRPVYDQQAMVEEVLAMDIGLFPLFQNDESLARGTLKAMVYMSGGAAAVCQDLGENQRLIADGVNGALAETDQEWFDKLDRLITCPEERRTIAQNGLATIHERFTRQKCFEQLVGVFDRLCDGADTA